MLHGFVEAQRAYARESRDGSGVRGFARKLVSASGRKDGLYWVADNSKGEASSPFAAMIGEPGAGDVPMLRNGYRYRILTAQGASAPGGAYSYVINGRLLAGFALIAYPAAVSQDRCDDVHRQSLWRCLRKESRSRHGDNRGKDSAYAPDASWRRIDD